MRTHESHAGNRPRRVWRGRRLMASAAALPVIAALSGCPQQPPNDPNVTVTTTSHALDCQGSAVQITASTSLTTTTRVTAPRSVAPNSTFDIAISLGSIRVPDSIPLGSYGNQTVSSMTDLSIDLLVPSWASLQSYSATGGNAGTTFVDATDQKVSVYVTGPMYGGRDIVLPTLTLRLTATGPVGSAISTRFAGTSYTDPTATVTTNISTSLGQASVPTTCFMTPNPTLSTTQVSAS